MTITLSPRAVRLGVAVTILFIGIIAGMAVSAATANAVVEDTTYTAVAPCASFDSRTDGSGAGFYTELEIRTYQITGTAPATQQGGVNCGVPAGAAAVLINIVAIQPQTIGNLRAFATGDTGTGGVVNYSPVSPGLNNSNAVTIPLSPAGQLDIQANCGGCTGNTVHARGIILGYHTNNLASQVNALQQAALPGRINLAVGDFVPRASNQEFTSSSQGITASGDQSIFMKAPVHLPQGATITKLVLVGTDNTSSGVFDGVLLRTEITPTASGTTSSTVKAMASADSSACNCNSVREIADTTITHPVVDNNQYVYHLDVLIGAPSANIIRLTAAYIEYTL